MSRCVYEKICSLRRPSETMGVVFIYHNLKGGVSLSAASHRAGFFHFTTKEVFKWQTIKKTISPDAGTPTEAAEQPAQPRDATRAEKEEIVYLNLSELHPFQNHPFGVRDDAEMQGLVESVKAAGVNGHLQGQICRSCVLYSGRPERRAGQFLRQ